MNTVQHLVEKLKTATPPEKQAAFAQLSGLGAIVISPLMFAVSEADEGEIDVMLSALEWEDDGENQKHDEPFQAFEDLITENCWYLLAATKILVSLGSSALEDLLAMTKHHRVGQRMWAIFTLGELGESQAIPMLMNLLDSANNQERVLSLKALGKLKATQAVDQIISLLDHVDLGATAEALGAIGDTRAIDPLIEELKRHKRNVYAVSSALALFGPPVVDKLIAVLSDKSAERVHDLVIMDLWIIGDKRAVAPILSMLESTQNPDVRQSAVSVLGMLGAPEAIEALNRVLHSVANIDLRFSAARSIAKIGGEAAFKTLVSAYEMGTPDVQHSAILAMGLLEHVADLSPLLTALKSDNHYLRSGAAVALGNLRDVRAKEGLQVALTDEDGTVRRYAAEALIKIDGHDQ